MVNKHRYWLLAIFVIAFLLRVSMWKNSLWLDEVLSVKQAVLSHQEIWVDSPNPVHPPLYYAILHEWINLFGDGEIAVRMPSLLISLVNMGLLYLLTKLIFDKNVALVATSLLAVSPLAVWYAGEVRMYVFVAFLGLLAAVGLVWEHWLGLVVYGVALATGLYMDYTFLPLWTALTAVWLLYWWLRGHHWWRLLGWGGVTLLAWFLYQPVYPQLFSMLARLNNVGLTYNIRKIIDLPAFEPSQYLLLLIPIALGILLGAIVLWSLLRRQSSRLILTILILVGFILVTLSMMLPRAYTVKRILLTGWPFVILLVAWLITQLPSRRREVWYGILGVSLATSLAMIAFIPKDDWRGLVSYINVNVDEQAVVLIDPRYNDIPYNYYEPNIPAATIPVTELEETAIPDVWLVIERAPGSNYLYTESEQWLDENRELVEIIPFYRLELRHYR